MHLLPLEMQLHLLRYLLHWMLEPPLLMPVMLQ